jgi:hypothetical protein
MTAALRDYYHIVLNTVNKPVCVIYSSAPKTAVFVFEQFRFPDSCRNGFKRIAVYIFGQDGLSF